MKVPDALKQHAPWLWLAVGSLTIAMSFLAHNLSDMIHTSTGIHDQLLQNEVTILSPADSVTWRWPVAENEFVQKEFHPRRNETDREFGERTIVNVREWKGMTMTSQQPPNTQEK